MNSDSSPILLEFFRSSGGITNGAGKNAIDGDCYSYVGLGNETVTAPGPVGESDNVTHWLEFHLMWGSGGAQYRNSL